MTSIVLLTKEVGFRPGAGSNRAGVFFTFHVLRFTFYATRNTLQRSNAPTLQRSYDAAVSNAAVASVAA